MNHTAQTACAQYLKITRHFKRMDMDEALKRFLKTCYWYEDYKKLAWKKKIEFYDTIYKTDPEIFIKYTAGKVKLTRKDTVIFDVRYVNELNALKEMGFIICRVTTNAKQVQPGKYIRTAAPGNVGLSLMYDKRFSLNHPANYSLNWTSKATTGALIDAFLERIGYKLDL